MQVERRILFDVRGAVREWRAERSGHRISGEAMRNEDAAQFRDGVQVRGIERALEYGPGSECRSGQARPRYGRAGAWSISHRGYAKSSTGLETRVPFCLILSDMEHMGLTR